MTLHRDNGLLAVICDDMIVRILDIETKKVVRELGGFRGRILDIVCQLVNPSLESVLTNLLRRFPRIQDGSLPVPWILSSERMMSQLVG